MTVRILTGRKIACSFRLRRTRELSVGSRWRLDIGQSIMAARGHSTLCVGAGDS